MSLNVIIFTLTRIMWNLNVELRFFKDNYKKNYTVFLKVSYLSRGEAKYKDFCEWA